MLRRAVKKALKMLSCFFTLLRGSSFGSKGL
ncbi:hypothetical protein CIPAW_09G026800 [Carya illinoinensis]|uniref:Uncharacterized protein n=1 Tax=Carya illinoinensis TaxID=32201 RepID=A0A8T1PGF1_CARIL|nr:hypothetical protein CIPAW_09G026800 [Carya illinoinensis]